ncbi:UDP-glucose 4-epimerase GalE [Candidatus Methylopumilus planktonicus]|uniref:UDP-glucose 4-epimerase GalE n=1 Tax=Candidatus Methylopumilus planktonicus TaxID=1581557 RepID=UPI003D18F337
MNILITGAAGYIGSHSTVELIQAGHHIVMLDNLINSHKVSVNCIEKITGKNVPFIECDLRNTVLVESVLRDYMIDAVIHFAGLKSVSESIKYPIEYTANNIQSTISLLIAMKNSNIKTLVFSSSATVYGEPKYLPLDELHPVSAVNPYGRNKLHIEEMLIDLVASDPLWKIISLRYFNPVGAHESGLIGENPIGIPNNLFPFISKVAAGELPYLKVYGGDYPTYDGTGIRDYIHVMDLAEGHLAALRYINKSAGYLTVNLGAGFGVSVLEVIKMYELVSHKKINYEVVERRPGDVAMCYANVDKAKLFLNWTPKRNLNAMCASAWYFQNKL